MNLYEKQFFQSLSELKVWLQKNPLVAESNGKFFIRIHKLLVQGCDAATDDGAVVIAKTITRLIVDSGPQEVLGDDFLPSHTLICRSIEKVEKRKGDAS